MQLTTILYPTDFSESGNGALALATSLARDNSARLLIIHVSEPPLATSGMVGQAPMPIAATTDEQRIELEKVIPFDPSVQCEHRLVEGSPSDGIIRTAQEEKADLIVMSTHGRTGLSRLLMGSVAEQVVRNAPCPVLTVKQPSQNGGA